MNFLPKKFSAQEFSVYPRSTTDSGRYFIVSKEQFFLKLIIKYKYPLIFKHLSCFIARNLVYPYKLLYIIWYLGAMFITVVIAYVICYFQLLKWSIVIYFYYSLYLFKISFYTRTQFSSILIVLAVINHVVMLSVPIPF